MMSEILSKSLNEKDVENTYRHYFLKYFKGMEITSPFGCDGFGVLGKVKILMEYKEDVNLHSRQDLSKVLAQIIFYIKKFYVNGLILPTTIFVGDKDECFTLHVNELIGYLDLDIDWSVAPSSAHSIPDLILKLINDETIRPFIYKSNDFDECLFKIKDLSENIQRKVLVTDKNITRVFTYFDKEVLGNCKLTTNEKANLFVQILVNKNENYLHPIKKRKTVVTKGFGEIQLVSREVFESFFNHFNSSYSPSQKDKLTAVVDRIVEDITRRKQGEFFTPSIWVDKAHEYISSVYGEDWKEKYVVWDPAWGTGNLTRDYKFKELYVSTLNYSDIETANQMNYNPEAYKFQFDFLNDDYDFLPEGLRRAIEDGRKIIVLMNPPYTDGSELTTKKGESKIAGGVNTRVNVEMKKLKIGKCSKQLYAQFIYRTLNLREDIKMAIFSPSLYLSGESYDVFHNKVIMNTNLSKGFLFAGTHFADTSGDWPILFSVWGGEVNNNVVDLLDVNNDYLIEKIGEKTIYRPTHRLSKTIKNTESGVIMGNCSFQGNSVSGNNQFVSLLPTNRKLSGKGNIEIGCDNFFDVVVFFSVRRMVSGRFCNWGTYYDEYLTPNDEHEQFKQFKYDSLVYSLFESKSNQSSFRQVEHQGELRDVNNEFFWMSVEKMKELTDQNSYDELYNDARTSSNRYVYNLLFGEDRIYDRLSPDAKLVLDKATELVVKSIQMREAMADNNNQLDCWDAGYAQLKLVWKEYFKDDFKEFRDLYKKMENRMRPLVYELGFLIK